MGSNKEQPPSPSIKQAEERTVTLSPEATNKIASDPNALKWDNLLDPFRYALRLAHMKRHATDESWGMEVSSTSADVVEITSLKPGGPADRTNTEMGAFVMAINGRRIHTPADVKAFFDAKRSDLCVTLAQRRRPPFDPNAPAPVPPKWDKLQNHEYRLIRVDPTDGRKIGAGVGVDRGGRVFVSVLTSDSAGMAAGLRIGDRIVTINGVLVTTKHQFRVMVKDGQGSPFDVVVERLGDPSQPAGSHSAHLPLRGTDEPGEPSTGVPQCPSDVDEFLGSRKKKVLDGIRTSAMSRSVMVVSSKSPTKHKNGQAKLKKEDIKATKLKRG